MTATTDVVRATTHQGGSSSGRITSARVRILAWVALLLALAGATTLVIQRSVLQSRLYDEVAASLLQEVKEVRVLAEQGLDPTTGQPFAGNVAGIFETFLGRNIQSAGEALITFVDGRPFLETASRYRFFEDPELVGRWANLLSTDRGELSTPEGPLRFIAVPLQGPAGTAGVFVVANFTGRELAEIDRTTRVGAVVYGSVLLVAVGLAWLIAGRVLAPVRAVTETAQEITESDLSRRIEVPASGDEIAELARTFNGMLDRLEHAFAGQRAFLDDAGHELRTPITVIRGYLEVEGDDPDERHLTRKVVFDELGRMARLVDDLLALARADRPDFLRRDAVDLDLLTTELARKAEALGDRDWRVAATGTGIVVADRDRLVQAVMNLFDNAVRHTAPGDRIELGSALVDGSARLWVRDSGPGVLPEDRERIFERFARAHDGRRHAGTAGLGLAIVSAVATAHGGRVSLDSDPGRGATFTIVIPTHPPGVIPTHPPGVIPTHPPAIPPS